MLYQIHFFAHKERINKKYLITGMKICSKKVVKFLINWQINRSNQSDSFSTSGIFACGQKKQRKSKTLHIKNIFLKLRPHLMDLFTNAYAGSVSQWRKSLINRILIVIHTRFHFFCNFTRISYIFNENNQNCLIKIKLYRILNAPSNFLAPL